MENSKRIPLSTPIAEMKELTQNQKLKEHWQRLEKWKFQNLEQVLVWLIRYPGDLHEAVISLGPCHYYTHYALLDQLFDGGWRDAIVQARSDMDQEIKKKLREAENA